MLATILRQSHAHAAPRMGRWEDISLDTVIQLTLGLDDGIWIKFVPHDGIWIKFVPHVKQIA